MLKKTILSIVTILAMVLLAVPANAQRKGLGKTLSKSAKDAGKAVKDAAGDMAADMTAQKVSEKIATFMDDNNTVSAEDSEYTKRLNTLVSSKYASVEGNALTYKVYENEEANIITLADGNIRVYSGMMDLLSDDELLAVIANQIGHFQNKDVRDNLMKVASEDNAGQAAGSQLEKMLSFSGEKLGSVINELLQVPYTEEQNKAADKFAFDLLKKNGNNTAGLASALNKFAELEANDAAILADEDSEEEVSVAGKYIGVNAGNADRASLIHSM